MKYYYQVEGDLRNNIGDVLQGMVAKAFLPANAAVADREDLASLDTTQPGYLVANGWYMHAFDKFPPPANITPLYVSVHVANAGLLKREEVREHFKKNGPIGCRDHKTLKLFLGWGIPAYYSGCLTVTSNARAAINTTGIGECLLVDNIDHPIPEDVKVKLETMLGETLTRVSHDPPDTTGTLDEYDSKGTAHMEMLLERYCKARMVITTKIHCALPCLGMGANVLIIHPDPTDPRLDTIREFINVISYKQVKEMSSIELPTVNKEALNNRRNFLSTLVNKGVKSITNPINSAPEYSSIKSESLRKAKLYRIAVKVMLALGIKKEQVKRVYGSN